MGDIVADVERSLLEKGDTRTLKFLHAILGQPGPQGVQEEWPSKDLPENARRVLRETEKLTKSK